MPEVNQNALVVQELVRRANSHTQRLRTVDEQMRQINSKLGNEEQHRLKMSKLNTDKFEKIIEEIENIDNRINDLKNELTKIHEKEKGFVKAKEINTIKKEMELLSPMKHEFVTWNELNREVRKLKDEFKVAVRP
ncbi:MAG: hypothetical protein DRP06_03280 [Candidatus Aenigmatarchaeota archaeon]|nr:MAG: hypothetical protein DRP06_03280 [Candidatus Aenigmarchaeota archaeon]